MNIKKHRVVKRRTNIMPEHLRKQKYITKELSNSSTRRILHVAQSNLDKYRWRVKYIEMNTVTSMEITFKNAHELCELGHPCYAYIDNTFIQVYEDYFIE